MRHQYVVKELEDGIYEVSSIHATYGTGKVTHVSKYKGTIVECNAYVSLKTNPAVMF